MTRQRLWQIKQKENGRCQICAKEQFVAGLCEKHYRHQRKWMKMWLTKKHDDGLCWCGIALKSKTYCAIHLIEARERSRKYRQQPKTKGQEMKTCDCINIMASIP